MKNRRVILVCLWGMCMCACLMAGCQQKKEADEMTKLTEKTIKETTREIKEKTETMTKSNIKTTQESQKKEISKIEIKWWAPCGSQEEDKYFDITDKKLISQVQREAEKAAKKAETEGKYIGDGPGLTGSTGYRLVLFSENKVMGEMDIVNGIIMGIDDGKTPKYYELKEIPFLKYLEDSNFQYKK